MGLYQKEFDKAQFAPERVAMAIVYLLEKEYGDALIADILKAGKIRFIDSCLKSNHFGFQLTRSAVGAAYDELKARYELRRRGSSTVQ